MRSFQSIANSFFQSVQCACFNENRFVAVSFFWFIVIFFVNNVV